MRIAEPEDYFTKEELETWVKSVGGIGAKIVIPEEAYWVNNGFCHTYQDRSDMPVGKMCEISGIYPYDILPQANYTVAFYNSNIAQHTWHLVWHDMRNIKPNKPMVLYNIKCIKCSAPARKCDGYVFCSNAKCKTRKKLSYIKHIKTLQGTKENPIPLTCSTCNLLGHYTIEKNSFHCIKGHKNYFQFECDKYYKWHQEDATEGIAFKCYSVDENKWVE